MTRIQYSFIKRGDLWIDIVCTWWAGLDFSGLIWSSLPSLIWWFQYCMFQLMYFVNVLDVLSLCSFSTWVAVIDMHGFQDIVDVSTGTIMKRRATPSEGVSNPVVNVTTNLVIVFMIINKSLLEQKSIDSMCATSIWKALNNRKLRLCHLLLGHILSVFVCRWLAPHQ